MDNFSQEIGIVAGKIWNCLNEQNGEIDVIKLKNSLEVTNSILFLALGWLLREDKIIIVNEKILKIKLK